MLYRPDDLERVARTRDRLIKNAEVRLQEAVGEALRRFLARARTEFRDALTAAGPPLPAAWLGLFEVGQMEGWWEEELEEGTLDAVRQTWQSGRSATTDLPQSRRSLDEAGEYLANVRDRLSRTATPTIPEQAFDLVRTGIAAEIALGSDTATIGRRIAADLQWQGTDTVFWEDRLQTLDSVIDRRLDGLGPQFVPDPERPGRMIENPVRREARLSDPEIRALQSQRRQAVSRLDADRTTWETRAERIARTESTGAFNAGAQTALIEEGAGAKMWLATGDQRTRMTHLLASGECVPTNEPFVVGGVTMMMPGDPSAPAEEVINCRCTIIGGRDCADLAEVAGTTLQQTAGEENWRNFDDGNLEPGTDTMMLNGREVDGRFEWDEARLRDVHDPFINHELSKGQSVDEPTMTFMGGGPASGKSTVINSGDVVLPRGHVLANADEVKDILPEYRAGTRVRSPKAASFVHEESSSVAKRLVAEAQDRSMNVVLDGTGNGSIDGLAGKVAQARASGSKRIIGEYVTVDTEVAVARSAARGAATGRFVPETVIRETHRAVSEVFPQAAARNLFDELRLYDTGLGGRPKLIYSKVNGVETIHDAARYQAFLDKAL